MSDYERNWDAARRALLIIRHLRSGPASRPELVQAVRQALPSAYADLSAKALQRAFERDLENARLRLGAEIAWNPHLRAYVLVDTGPLIQLELSDAALVGLAFLTDLFNTSSEVVAIIEPLLDWVRTAVTSEQLRTLGRHTATLSVSLRRLSESEIAPVVWQHVNDAIRARRLLRFSYASPIHERDEPRIHTVEPYTLFFRGGHYYLRAYCRRWVAPDGYSGGSFWASPYRLDYILPDAIELQRSFEPRPQQRPLHTIRYKLSPKIVRGGISRYFSNMQAGEPDADGWVTVTAETDNLFDAHRILLGYGEQCVALAPPDLVERMTTAVGEMAARYAANENRET